MDYEKKYKEALEKAKQFSEHQYLEDSGGVVEYIFPELREPEDEKIRKAIIKHFKTGTEYVSFSGFSKDEIINWLEKQGEQKPAEWSDDDKKLIDDTCRLINMLASGYGEKVTEPITLSGTQMIASIKDRLRALVDNRPKSTWRPSGEQMEVI